MAWTTAQTFWKRAPKLEDFMPGPSRRPSREELWSKLDAFASLPGVVRVTSDQEE